MNKILRNVKIVYMINAGLPYDVGRFTKELTPEGKEVYRVKVEEEKMDRLVEQGFYPIRDFIIPGIDLYDSFDKIWKGVPKFIGGRIPDPRRPNMDKILAEWGLTEYDPFEIFVRNKGIGLDNWQFHEVEIGE